MFMIINQISKMYLNVCAQFSFVHSKMGNVTSNIFLIERKFHFHDFHSLVISRQYSDKCEKRQE